MKKIFFTLIFLFSINYTFADSWTSSTTWNNNHVWCQISNSHWVVHQWVPISNNWNAWISWTLNCTTHSYYSSSDHTISFTYNNSWKITACPAWERVVNWNERARTMVCRKYDDTPPTAADIAWTTPSNWFDLLATNSQNFKVNVSNNWWSPITSVKVFFENWDTTNSFLWTSHEYIASWYNENIQNVDNSVSNWARQYLLQVAKICDEANNCVWTDSLSSNLATATYNVYANTNYITTKEVTTNNLALSSNYADWNYKDYKISLKDVYWNKIRKATDIGREINFKFTYNNTLYKNQFNQSNWSAIYMNSCWTAGFDYNLPIWISKTCSDEWWNNWLYPYQFAAYTPTKEADTKSTWDFEITDVQFSITDTKFWNKAFTSLDATNKAVISKFKPLYTTTFAWSQKSGFIEWLVQSWSLKLVANTWASVTDLNTYLRFGWTVSNYNLKYAISWNPTSLISKTDKSLFKSYSTPDTTTLRTKLVQTNPVGTNLSVYLSSHIWYKINKWFWDIYVLYNSDIIWASKYIPWTTPIFTYNNSQKANQSQIKVYGNVWTTKSTAINSFTTDQWWNIKEINWWFDKAWLRWNILEWVTRLINSIPWNTQDNNSVLPGLTSAIITATSDSAVVWDKKNIILYKGNKLVSLHNWDYDWNPIWISWKKTIVIYWGDLYINKNMYYTDTSSVLWIIVMKDSAGKWWNIYINPNVTNIVWTIYASRSLLSASIKSTSPFLNIPNNYSDYDSMDYYDWNSDADILKNQLYIYWSLFSANTLGWSKSSPKKCPYYVSVRSCDADTSIKYDLNFLRRYYLVDDGSAKKPYQDWKVIWWCKLTSVGWLNCTSSLTKLFTSINYANPWDAAYPLIIKYNSNLQTNPPPLFSNN